MKEKVIVATDGILDTMNAKTAHGLIRGSDRFEVLGIVDHVHAGNDAGEVLDGRSRSIPIFKSISESTTQLKEVQTLVIGVATVGGVLSSSLLKTVSEAINQGLNVINGLHDRLHEHPDIVQLAKSKGVTLRDIRRPKTVKELHFWTGKIYEVKAPIIAVLGMDCAVGKRTVARMIMESAKNKGLNAQMIFTGQTGWMQGSKYGFIFDSTLNDFVSGELEYAITSCWENEKPDVILLEGQSSLRNPSGPCGAEFILSGNAQNVVLVHSPGRKHFDEDPKWGPIPSVASEIELIEKYGARVIGLSLNTWGLDIKQARSYQNQFTKELNIPVILPLEDGMDELIINLEKLIQ